MGRRTHRALTLLLGMLPLAACGDPLIIVGDSPGYMRVVAGVGDSSGVTINEAATRTLLTEPRALAFDADAGVLFIADRGATVTEGGISTRAARLFSVSANGTLSTIFTDGGCARGACIREPVQLALAPDRSLLIADLVGARVLRLSADRSSIGVVAGSGSLGDSEDGTPATQAALRGVGGVTVAPDGAIYFSETGGHRVRTIAPDGSLQTVAGSSVEGSGGDGGAATAARLSGPRGLAIAGSTLYIADAGNHVVRAVDLAPGSIATVAGTPRVPGFSGDGGAARGARLSGPTGVTVTPDEATLYIADVGNRRVRAVALGSGTIITFAGTGTADFAGTGTPAGITPLRVPAAVEAGEFGFLFIADAGQHVVWRTSVRLQP